jgi:uncharacterized protein (DUF4415 family)
MPTNNKPNAISPLFSSEQIAAALASAPQASDAEDIDWDRAVVTEGGGVKTTLESLRRNRGINNPRSKEQVAIRFSPEVLAYFRAQGRDWQTCMDEALKEFIASHPKA